MTSTNIAQLRFRNQHIHKNEINSVKQLVHWMGAIQAQDYSMAKYAIAVRLKIQLIKQLKKQSTTQKSFARMRFVPPGILLPLKMYDGCWS
jgi:hypothetical protein